MQDIWLIRELSPLTNAGSGPAFEVHHHQLDGSNWRSEGSLPWKEFVGSHKALSSFSMPDTLVYLALPCSDNPDRHTPEVWMALCNSPSRLVYAEAMGIHLTLIEQIQTMGKEVLVCALRAAHVEITANSFGEIFSLVTQSERIEIEKWHRKKAAVQTIVDCDWTLGLSLLLRGNGVWLKSRLITGLMLVAVGAALIHLALEGLRTQTQRLAGQHRQALAQLESSNPVSQKQINWTWLARTLKAVQANDQTQSLTAEHLAITWDKSGAMQVLLQSESQSNSKGRGSPARLHQENCKQGRQGWVACANDQEHPVDKNRE